MIDLMLTFLLFLIGVYGLCISRNIVKSILSLNICQVSGILFFLHLSYVANASVPIMPFSSSTVVDPLPQAFMITSIVIGASITSLALMFCIKIFHHFGSLDWNTIYEKKDPDNPDYKELT